MIIISLQPEIIRRSEKVIFLKRRALLGVNVHLVNSHKVVHGKLGIQLAHLHRPPTWVTVEKSTVIRAKPFHIPREGSIKTRVNFDISFS